MGAATCPGDEKGTIHLGLLMGAADCPGGGNGTIHLGLLMEAADCPGGENGGDSSLIGDSLLLLRILIACCVTCSAWEDTKQMLYSHARYQPRGTVFTVTTCRTLRRSFPTCHH